jgi:diguanylate cyclase (GGDEF)-like protein
MERRFPVPPGVVARVVRAAADPDVKISELASILDKDAVLSAQVLKTVNSATFGLRSKVASVERAIAFLGIRALRNLVLSVGVRDLVPANDISGYPLDVFWESSLRRAASAQCLAEELELANVEEYFTVGLCQDLGLLVRLAEDPVLAARLWEGRGEPAEVRVAMEREEGEGHDEIGAAMFSDWSFPAELIVPIRCQHDPESAPAEFRTAARVAAAAEAFADLTCANDPQGAIVHAATRLRDLGLGVDPLTATAPRVNLLVEEFADILGLNVEEQPSLDEIIATAGRGLADINASYENSTRELESALEEQAVVTNDLERANRVLEHESRTDPLTRLANRRAFDEALSAALAVSARQQAPLSVLIVDLDKFKQINDTHGHPAGDAVLQAVAVLLKQALRLSDSPARLGGEEFGVILPFTGTEGGKTAADRIRRAIEEGAFAWGGTSLKVTASVGGATLEQAPPPDHQCAEALLESADRALYEAKESGRNRCCWAGSEAPALATD